MAMDITKIKQVEQKIVELSELSPNAKLCFEQLHQVLPNLEMKELGDVLLYLAEENCINATIQSYHGEHAVKRFTITTAFIKKHLEDARVTGTPILAADGEGVVKGREDKWIDAYLSDEIDAPLFAFLIVLEKLFSKKFPSKVKETINKAIECLVLNKHFTAKQEQEIKNALNEAKRASNEGDSDGVDLAMEKISNIHK
jgi:hypothetical protein